MFNEEMSVDLMFLDKLPVVQVVDTRTHFESANFDRSQTSEHIWKAFFGIWVCVYTGYPGKIKKDQGKQFASKYRSGMSSITGVENVI